MLDAMIIQFRENDRRIFWILVCAIAVCAALYLYLLSISVFSVVARKSTEQKIEAKMSHVSVLESEYASLSKNINLSFAYERGFVDVSGARHVSSISEPIVLTMRDFHSASR